MKTYINAIDTEGDRRIEIWRGSEIIVIPLTDITVAKLIQQLAGMLISGGDVCE